MFKKFPYSFKLYLFQITSLSYHPTISYHPGADASLVVKGVSLWLEGYGFESS